MTTYEPQVGDYGVVKTGGFFGMLIRIGTTSRWNHSVIYIGDGKVVSADPTGVKINPVSDYAHIAWNQHEALDGNQRQQIAAFAKAAVGSPYSFITIFGLVIRILGLKVLGKFLIAKLAQGTGYICSELVAECYRKAGVPLGEEDYLVVPGDLAERLIWQ
jgi:cell wall-associated NlpC family hydrolase